MSFVDSIVERCETPLVIAFVDLHGFTVQASRLSDAAVAETMHEYYVLLAGKVSTAGGHVVKYIGDGALVVFPMEQADAGICALLDLQTEVDSWLASREWSCRMVLRVHAAPVIAGVFGSGANARFDVIGNAVNVAATMRPSGVALTEEAFRELSAETQKQFKKHTPAVTYIPSEAQPPHRTGRS